MGADLRPDLHLELQHKLPQLPAALPNLRVIEPNVRYFVANHARGMFMQAAGNAPGRRDVRPAQLPDRRPAVGPRPAAGKS